MRRVFAGIVAVAALLAAGCGKSSPDLTPVQSPLAPYIGMWMANDHGGTITLNVLQSEKFSLSAVGPPSAPGKNDGSKILVTGAAGIQNGRLVLTAQDINGKPPTSENDKKPELFLLSKDGKTIEAADGTKLTRS